MKTLLCSALFALAPLTAFATTQAAELEAALTAVAFEDVSGTVKSFDADTNTPVVTDDDGAEHSYRIRSDTSYTLDGEAARRDQVLVAGTKVTVTAENGAASKVAGTSN